VLANDGTCTPVPPPNLHGKEGVDGSSPSEGSAKSPLTGIYVQNDLLFIARGVGMEPFMELPRSDKAHRGNHGRRRLAHERTRSYRRASMSSPRHDDAQRLLAPLRVGDQLPLTLDEQGDPRWLTVVEVVSG
jgi:hypothetical protein